MADDQQTGETAAAQAGSGQEAGWLNRNVLGAGLTSFLADAGYETATTLLPSFLGQLAGRQAALWLGLIEGISDAISSSVKLASGWWGDRLGRRKPIVVAGYALTGAATGLFALALTWPVVLLGRVLAWFGKGIRGPLRNAILAESVPPEHRGKVFGFHRAGDTLGAIVGPLAGVALLVLLRPTAGGDETAPYRTIFLLALIPGLGSALTFALMIQERRRAANPRMRLWTSIRNLPAGFRRLLVGVGVFGAGDFAHGLLILAATEILSPAYPAQAAVIGGSLYVARNVVYAGASYPVGHLGDRYGRRMLLVLGYVLGGLVMAGFALAFAAGLASPVLLGVLFGLAGLYIAVEDALEPALAADLVPDAAVRGTAYGVMGTVNGLGDFLSSVMVGTLWWAVGAEAGFLASAVFMLAGAVLLHRVR